MTKLIEIKEGRTNLSAHLPQEVISVLTPSKHFSLPSQMDVAPIMPVGQTTGEKNRCKAQVYTNSNVYAQEIALKCGLLQSNE